MERILSLWSRLIQRPLERQMRYVQRVADRASGIVATAAALGVVAITGATMWLLWWA